MKLLLSVSEARETLGGISAQTLYKEINRGALPVVKIAGRTFFRPADLENYIERRVRSSVESVGNPCYDPPSWDSTVGARPEDAAPEST